MDNLSRLVLIGFVSSLSVFGGSMIAPVEARFIESITNNSIITGSVFGVASIFFAILSYWLGTLSDRYGRKRLILLGLGSGVLYAFLYASVMNVFELYGLKFAWAFAAVGMGPILNVYLQDFLAPLPNKGRLFGYVYSAQSVAGSVGALTGGFLATNFGITAPFVGLSFVFALMFVIVLLFFQEQKQDSAHATSSTSFLDTLRYVVRSPELRFYLIFNTSFSINWGIKNFLWPLVIFALAGNDLITGSIYATMGVIAFVLLPFAGGWVDKYGTYRLTFLQFLCLGIAGVMMALTDSLTVFWIFVGLYTIGEVLNLTQIVLITESVPSDRRGAVLGLDSAMDQILMVLSPLMAGVLITFMGLSMTLLVFMSLYWMSLVLGIIVYRRMPATHT